VRIRRIPSKGDEIGVTPPSEIVLPPAAAGNKRLPGGTDMPRRTAFAQALVDTVRREVAEEIHRVLGSLLGGTPTGTARRRAAAEGDGEVGAAEATPRPKRRRRRA
jgi:hypothetical protein